MRHATWLSLTLALALPALARAQIAMPNLRTCEQLQSCLGGQIVDHTCNSGQDNRIFSRALLEKRDLYVYLPPGYDPNKKYPLMIYLHGYLEDERGFLRYVAGPLDQAIQSGKLPPLIVAAPDGTIRGTTNIHDPGSFFLNSRAGDFQDWVLCDVWEFMMKNYPIRPEKEAHMLVGVSMGGFGAYNIAIKHRDRFKIVAGVLPALNLRWMSTNGDYMADFNWLCWGWRNSADDPDEVIGSFFGGLVRLNMAEAMYPIFGTGPRSILCASRENPIEMVDRYRLRNGELDMWIGYAAFDEFNLDAQAESFLYLIKSRGIDASVYYDPSGDHSRRTAVKMIPSIIDWLGERLEAHGLHERKCNVQVLPAPPVVSDNCDLPACGSNPCKPGKPICKPSVP